MIQKAAENGIEVWAWWPAFHDAQMARRFPGHTYKTNRGEYLVDPSVPEIQRRQEELLEKLVAEYDFDGISLDWIRYNSWEDGHRGPLAGRFRQQTGQAWDTKLLDDEYYRAQWYQLRAQALNDWISGLVSRWRKSKPKLRWGAFLLPYQFTEVNQDYRSLSRTGLDFLQPMAYWDNWHFPPKWVGETLLSRQEWLSGGTGFWPVLDLENSEQEIKEALESLPSDNIAGLSYFVYGAWDQSHFDRLKKVLANSNEARHPQAPQVISPPRQGEGAKPEHFSVDAGVWSIVCLAELYRRGALEESLSPAIPVLGFHHFTREEKAANENLWITSTKYLDDLFAFIRQAGFNVIPLSRLQAYLMVGDQAMLPSRPLILTIDDGSATILKDFYPRALKYGYPFTVSLITGWVFQSEERRHKTIEGNKEDPVLIWPEIQQLKESGLAEFASHSDNLHYWAVQEEDSLASSPAILARKYLFARQRQETESEYRGRVYEDLLYSRKVIADRLGQAATVFAWPYGIFDEKSKGMARQAGFTHFLLFEGRAFASYGREVENIPRISVTQADEIVPLRFPENKEKAQQWWLAFLKVARSSASKDLIRATLQQLTAKANTHPEAEISKAMLEFLEGESAAAGQRIKILRSLYPHDTNVHGSIDEFLKIAGR